jgi:DUF971 family protein
MMSQAPLKIRFHRQSQQLTLVFSDDFAPTLSAEFLRVHSPSAEVKGHGPNQAVLQVGKRDVKIESLEPAGNYALKIFFDDGHNTGIYSWEYLSHLGHHQESLWQDYLKALEEKGQSRDKDTSIVRFV